MADVQIDEGEFTRIANALLEALCKVRIPGRHMALMLAVIRKTYGYNRREDRIPVSQLCELTAIDEREIRRILADLISWNMLIRTGGMAGRGHTAAWRVQKDFDLWKPGEGTRISNPKPGRETRVSAPGFLTLKPGVEHPLKPGLCTPLKRQKDKEEKKSARKRTLDGSVSPVGPFIDAFRKHRKADYGIPSGQDAGRLKSVMAASGSFEAYLAVLEEFFASKQRVYSIAELQHSRPELHARAQHRARERIDAEVSRARIAAADAIDGGDLFDRAEGKIR